MFDPLRMPWKHTHTHTNAHRHTHTHKRAQAHMHTHTHTLTMFMIVSSLEGIVSDRIISNRTGFFYFHKS